MVYGLCYGCDGLCGRPAPGLAMMRPALHSAVPCASTGGSSVAALRSVVPCGLSLVAALWRPAGQCVMRQCRSRAGSRVVHQPLPAPHSCTTRCLPQSRANDTGWCCSAHLLLLRGLSAEGTKRWAVCALTALQEARLGGGWTGQGPGPLAQVSGVCGVRVLG